MKTCLIRQPAGLGDIIFCQKIADKFINDGYNVCWVVADVYYDTAQKYMKKEGITFYKEDDDFPMKNLYFSNVAVPAAIEGTENIYIPLQLADRNFFNESVMKVKYKILNIDYDGWQKHFVLERDKEREDHLFYEVLKLQDDSEYNIVNRWFGTTWDGYRENMDISNDFPVVEMKNLGFDNIFDWCKVFENATEIHTVETAICYILENLNLKADRACLYTRNSPEVGFEKTVGINDIYKNVNWEYIL